MGRVNISKREGQFSKHRKSNDSMALYNFSHLPFCISISCVKLAQTINCVKADWTFSSVNSHGKPIMHLSSSSFVTFSSSGNTSNVSYLGAERTCVSVHLDNAVDVSCRR